MKGLFKIFNIQCIFAQMNQLIRAIVHSCTLSFLLFTSCTTVDLYEKTVSLPNHEWKGDYKPEFNFTINDTTTAYQVFFVIRHTEKYNYNNIWINLYSQPPGDTLHKAPYELQLATNEKGWLGTGMDDIYEHRKELTGKITLKAGNINYTGKYYA